jgi:hypothetical protein
MSRAFLRRPAMAACLCTLPLVLSWGCVPPASPPTDTPNVVPAMQGTWQGIISGTPKIELTLDPNGQPVAGTVAGDLMIGALPFDVPTLNLDGQGHGLQTTGLPLTFTYFGDVQVAKEGAQDTLAVGESITLTIGVKMYFGLLTTPPADTPLVDAVLTWQGHFTGPNEAIGDLQSVATLSQAAIDAANFLQIDIAPENLSQSASNVQLIRQP